MGGNGQWEGEMNRDLDIARYPAPPPFYPYKRECLFKARYLGLASSNFAR